MAVEYIIEGERAALDTLRRELALTYANWLNRVDVRRGLAHLGVFDREAEEGWRLGRGRGHLRVGAARRCSGGRRIDEVIMDAVPGDFAGSVIARG